MRRVLKVLAWVFSMTAAGLAASAPADIGVVLLHGKQGAGDDMVISGIAQSLRDAGYPVATPTTAWSRNRIYDKSVDEAMLEIEQDIRALREKGAKKIVIGGQSLGGNIAIRFGATRSDLAGIIALAPAHNPDSANARRLFAADLERARKLIGEGKGDVAERFLDANVGTFNVVVSPRAYLSWWGESDGALLMPRNAAAFKAAVPLLYVVGSGDALTRPREEVFDKAPAHPLSKYVVVDATHLQVPNAARSVVLDWLAQLQK